MSTLPIAAGPSVDNPHTLVFFVAALLSLALTFIPKGNKRSLSWQRKVYWSGTFGAAVCAFIASIPNFTTGALLAAFAVFLMTVSAYFTSQYIKIGSRVIAFQSATDLTDRAGGSGELTDDEPYGSRVSAAKMWWLAVPSVGIGSVNLFGYLYDNDGLVYGLLGLGILVATGLLIGCGDGLWRQRVARGQYLQFAIVAVISAGIFAVSYLVAYSAALRWKDSSR
ncbi:hypothetical protein [Mycolicibacterium palauense]|uniref:hypothetical protein n=1 Tax=Mycolicibacterium palauense TaxID=2034511 RepID=UPI000BFF1831|nr:hypothetical protein [Mycolicibacterium palauense]